MSVPTHATISQDESINYTGASPSSTRSEVGPLPVIIMTLGRSGSSSTWQVMGKLTGGATPSE